MLNLALCYLGPTAVIFYQNTIGSDFSDLGRKLLGGFLVGVAFAVAFAVSKVRQRDKNPPKSFISIIASESRDVTADPHGESE
jgi:hypothetical protein